MKAITLSFLFSLLCCLFASLSLSLSASLFPSSCHDMSTTSSSTDAAPPTLESLGQRVDKLERKDRGRELYVMMKEKKDLLTALMKSYSDNIIIKGMRFAIKDVQKDEGAEEKFRVKALQVLVDQGLVAAVKVFVLKGDQKGSILRGVLRHAHPLGTKDNCSVVVAFLESWFVASILGKIANGKKLTNGIRICQHVPPIIDALKNEALKSRKAKLAANRQRKIIVKTTEKAPWVQMMEVKDGKKEVIEFEVDDSRLIYPALTLAKLERDDKGFVQKAFLPVDEREAIQPGVVRPHDDLEALDAELNDIDVF